jgi:hypothetical protein
VPPNGARVEDVIAAAIGRIEFYQRSRHHCIENAVALGHLRAAVEVLEERTRARADRGIGVIYGERSTTRARLDHEASGKVRVSVS